MTRIGDLVVRMNVERSCKLELRASGFPDIDGQLRESLLDPVDPDWVMAFFEQSAR